MEIGGDVSTDVSSLGWLTITATTPLAITFSQTSIAERIGFDFKTNELALNFAVLKTLLESALIFFTASLKIFMCSGDESIAPIPKETVALQLA